MPSHTIDLFGHQVQPVDQKRCRDCRVQKPLAQFSKVYSNPKNQKSWYKTRCKLCDAKAGREWYHKNKDGKALTRALKASFGITADEFYRMLNEQGGGCAICGRQKTKRRLAVDHDHATGKIRGVLCHLCNQAIGQFRHDPRLLLKAVEYLQKHA